MGLQQQQIKHIIINLERNSIVVDNVDHHEYLRWGQKQYKRMERERDRERGKSRERERERE
jgi:hypothetical protein